MRRLNMILFFSLLTIAANAQFVNNGATVTIQAGATLRVESSFLNNAGGTVTNNGILEVQDDFTNAGTFTSDAASTVKFIGTDNTDVTSGGATLANVEMLKTAQNITLMDDMAVSGTLTFINDNNKVILGAHDLTIGATGSIASADDNEYIVTDGTGQLIKGLTASGTITHEIGDAANYTPISNEVTGSAYASATLGARVVDSTHPSKPSEADSYLSRYWVVNANGITEYSNSMTGTYASSGDTNGTPSRIKGATFIPSTWSYTGATTNSTSTITGSTSNDAVDFTGMNALNKLDITAFLYGAMPSSGTTMTNYLQTYSPLLLPPTSPYGVPTSTYSDIGNVAGVAGTVTDWVKVEVRDASNPATILETRSLLLKTNGHIVDVYGSVPYFKDNVSPVQIAVHHRNHLAVLSNSIASFEGTNISYDFSSGLSQAFNPSNDPNQMQLKNGVWCLNTGDVNSDLSVDANDTPSFFMEFNLGSFDLYINTDLNLDGAMDANDTPFFFTPFNSGYYSTILNY
ncbi:MAG: hypothetical protein R2774_11250 [Saprospiraceae bacterium]